MSHANYSIPQKALEQHIAILGKTGSGKTTDPTEPDCAYAAGFFDGEGFVIIAARKVNGARGLCYTMRVGVAQNDPRPLYWLQERWGGSVRPVRRKTSAGNVTHIWMCFTRNAEKFLVDVKPFLQVKRRRAHIAIKFQRAVFIPGVNGLPDEHRAYLAHLKARMNSLNVSKEH